MIQAHNPMIIPMDNGRLAKTVAVEFTSGEKIISLSLNNSNGNMDMLGRSDVRCFVGKDDVTQQVFCTDKDHSIVDASLDNMDQAMRWLRRVSWGMDGV
jgi:hypothetical protein